MKLIVSGTGHLDDRGVYISTPQDKQESLELMDVFYQKSQKLLDKTFPQVILPENYLEVEGFEGNPRYDHILRSAECRFKVAIPDWGYSPNFRKKYDRSYAYVDLRTGINPHGFDHKVIKRSFHIYFWMRGEFRPKFGRNWIETSILSYMCFSDDMGDCINQFQEYLDHGYRYFIHYRVKHNFKTLSLV